MSIDSNRLTKSVNKLRKFLKKDSNTQHPEEIHGFRTHARRLEATVEALRLDSKGNEQHLLKRLGRLRKRAGKIRDMDVLTAYASTMRVDDEQDCSVQLLEHLGAERSKHSKKMERQIVNARQILRHGLNRCLTHINHLLAKKDKRSAQTKKSQADAMASALQLSSELRRPEQLDRESLHPFRLKVKKLRYILQMSNGADNQEFVQKLGEVKDAIGEWHDWEELSAMAKELLSHGSSCKLLSELRTISEEKYEGALSLTNEMRQTYLSESANGAIFPDQEPKGLSQPILAATSAIGE